MTVLLGDEFARVLAAARDGEEWAVGRLYSTLQPSVLRYLASRDPGEAEDIASQVWLEVARALPSFDGGEDDFRAFVFTVARRRLANARRGRRRRRTDAVPVASLVDVQAPDDPADEAATRLEGEAAVRRITLLLPPEQAEVVILRVVAGLSADDVAAIVGKRPATIRVIQHRALRRLARTLSKKA